MTPSAIRPGLGEPIGTKVRRGTPPPESLHRDIPRFAKYRAYNRDIPRLPASELRARLALIAPPIGPNDVLISGKALARELTLVTHNTAEFGRIEGLAVEDWEAP
jgi:predicted nucleic acid-binding protein